MNIDEERERGDPEWLPYMYSLNDLNIELFGKKPQRWFLHADSWDMLFNGMEPIWRVESEVSKEKFGSNFLFMNHVIIRQEPCAIAGQEFVLTIYYANGTCELQRRSDKRGEDSRIMSEEEPKKQATTWDEKLKEELNDGVDTWGRIAKKYK